ncbi:MAG: hypothetical protein ACPG4Y_00775 [Chitinophagales bacterium]
MIKLKMFSILLIFLSLACTKNVDVGAVSGKKPVYISLEKYTNVKSENAKPFEIVGKIFKIGHTIYISDKGTGVHVINNANPSAPTKQAFISILGNNDMAVKNNVMFADNGDDLLAIDISDVSNIAVAKRLKNVYQFNAGYFPTDYFGYFECVDEQKGIALDWVDAKLENPKCRR